jgi:membrane fusion protein (multidrug efflux system)
MHLMRTRTALLCLVAAGLPLLDACGERKAEAAPGGPPPVEVKVVTIKPQQIALATELPGRTTPLRVAEVRPQVTGVVLQRLFTEGSEVQAGQQLYQIDARSYQATYDSAVASLERAKATLASASLLAERYRSLISAAAISQQQLDDAAAAERQARADVAAAEAAVESAHINLVYTKVLSPIGGRIGRSAITEGALVTASQATALSTVQQLDPIYVDVTQSTTQLLRLQRALASGELRGAGANQAAVRLTLEDGTEYAQPGRLLFSETTVDQSTGSVTLRAVFPNPQRQLLPGMFVHARLVEGVSASALLVPQQGVARNQQGQPMALVVDATGKVEQRNLSVDRAVGDQWLVRTGLKPGDQVIVEGLQRARPGTVVHAVEAQAADAAPAAPAGPPGGGGAERGKSASVVGDNPGERK